MNSTQSQNIAIKKSKIVYFLDVAAEKTKNSLVAGIESFNPLQLKHTETQEKNQLPDKQGIR